jgi:hypothetical protein
MWKDDALAMTFTYQDSKLKDLLDGDKLALVCASTLGSSDSCWIAWPALAALTLASARTTLLSSF